MPVLLPTPLVAAARFALKDLGAADIMPLVTSIGYAGYLLVLPIFGMIADLASLRVAISLLVLSGAVIASKHIRPH